MAAFAVSRVVVSVVVVVSMVCVLGGLCRWVYLAADPRHTSAGYLAAFFCGQMVGV